MYAGSAGCPLAMCKAICVVAPIYFLVWYNASIHASASGVVVVPIYFLVWYNRMSAIPGDGEVVVPIYFLVWYNTPLYNYYK